MSNQARVYPVSCWTILRISAIVRYLASHRFNNELEMGDNSGIFHLNNTFIHIAIYLSGYPNWLILLGARSVNG